MPGGTYARVLRGRDALTATQAPRNNRLMSTTIEDLSLTNLPGPASVPSYRVERYIGDELAVSLEHFSNDDRELVLDLYKRLRAALRIVQTGMEEDNPLSAVRNLEEVDLRTFMLRFSRAFGTTGLMGIDQDRSRQILHDIRGSALSIVNARVDLLMMRGSDAEQDDLIGVFTSIRDHLKILRNCVSDIDPERRRQDLERKTHAAGLLREKWSNYATASVEVHYISDFDGDLSSCCLEFSSLERVLYNLTNNAIRHAPDGEVWFFVTHVPDPEGAGSAKFVLANRIKDTERERLVAEFGDRLGRLFAGGFSIGGTGVGLRVVADLVKNAYGIGTLEELIEGGYVGAEIRGGAFVSWVHWPVLG